MSVGLLILRVVVGLLLFGHGAQKLFGWYGGHGLAGTGGFFESLGFRPGRPHAAIAGMSEAAGGLLLACGLVTPFAAAMVIGVMLVATISVHLHNGVWANDGGYELPLTNAAAAFCLAFTGGGAWSLDRVIGISDDLSGYYTGAGALGLAILCAAPMLLARAARQRRATAVPYPGEQPAETAAPIDADVRR